MHRFERLRRPNIGGRRCAPCDNSWVAVDRVIYDRQAALLCHRNHDCTGGPALVSDFHSPALAALGVRVLATIRDPDGHENVVVTGPPGVRLRALAEAVVHAGERLPATIVAYIVAQTKQQCAAWSQAGVEPGDTFIGFDGSVHLFPRLSHCYDAEMPSFIGDEVFDLLIVDGSPDRVAQLTSGTLPQPHLAGIAHAARIAAGELSPELSTPPAEHTQQQSPAAAEQAQAALATLAQRVFSDIYHHHRQIYHQFIAG